MSRFFLLTALFAAALVGSHPLRAESSGAPTRSTGGNFPAESSCANSMCHSTTINSGPGSLAVTMNGTPIGELASYVPRQVYEVIVTVAENGKNRWGFQMTARSEDGCLQAGDFQTTSDDLVQIRNDSATPEGCGGSTIEFPTHLFAKSGGTGASYTFQWTAPSEGFGQVRFAAAGNAANGNGQRTGDSIYALETAAAEGAGSGPQPMIFTEGGVRHGATLDAAHGVAPNTFISIFGIELATGVSNWDQGFVSNFGPTQLGGAEVRVNGVSAYLSFAGEDLGGFDQLNAVIPDLVAPGEDPVLGPVNVEVITAGGTSNSFVVQMAEVAPGFFLFDQDGRRHVAAVQNDFSAFVGPNNLFGGAAALPALPANPGDAVALFFAGGGATDPPLEAGRLPIPDVIYNMTQPIRVLIGGMEAQVFFAGLSSNVAVYQAVIAVPNLGQGLHDVVAEIGGVQTQTGVVMAVGGP